MQKDHSDKLEELKTEYEVKILELEAKMEEMKDTTALEASMVEKLN